MSLTPAHRRRLARRLDNLAGAALCAANVPCPANDVRVRCEAEALAEALARALPGPEDEGPVPPADSPPG